MSAFQSHPSSVLNVATNSIQIYQKCTVLKGNCVPACFVKISAWKEGQDLVNVFNKGLRELHSLGITNILPSKGKKKRKKKEKEGDSSGETHHAAASEKAYNYHVTEILMRPCH